jgi:hypothetical protein
MLDIDFGTYPFVTSSNTITAAYVPAWAWRPQRIGRVIGITKAYCTRVGGGPFPTELDNETGDLLRQAGQEFGSTTGRPRRCGWIDLPQLRYTIQLTGTTELCMTKIDVLNIPSPKSPPPPITALAASPPLPCLTTFARPTWRPCSNPIKAGNAPLTPRRLSRTCR